MMNEYVHSRVFRNAVSHQCPSVGLNAGDLDWNRLSMNPNLPSASSQWSDWFKKAAEQNAEPQVVIPLKLRTAQQQEARRDDAATSPATTDVSMVALVKRFEQQLSELKTQLTATVKSQKEQGVKIDAQGEEISVLQQTNKDQQTTIDAQGEEIFVLQQTNKDQQTTIDAQGKKIFVLEETNKTQQKIIDAQDVKIEAQGTLLLCKRRSRNKATRSKRTENPSRCKRRRSPI